MQHFFCFCIIIIRPLQCRKSTPTICSQWLQQIRFLHQMQSQKKESQQHLPLSKLLQRNWNPHPFNSFLGASSEAGEARLLSVSAPRAASWLPVVPSPGLGLHLEPGPLLGGGHLWWIPESCLLRESFGHPLGHHALTCRHRCDVVTWHNLLRDTVAHLFCEGPTRE